MTSPAVRRDGLLRDLTETECWAHLTAHSLGRIAYVVDGGPTILPFNYLARDGVIWLRTTSYSELAIHLPGQQAAFAVDHADEHDHTGWSVLVRGRAEHALGEHPAVPGGAPDPTPWPDGTRTMVFRLTPEKVSGRALRQADVAPGAAQTPGNVQRAHGGAPVAPPR
jgi:hypothetical protein